MQLDRAFLARWAPLPIRLIVGYGFMMHGYLKLERGVEVFAVALQGLGVPAPDFMAWATVVIEVLGGHGQELDGAEAELQMHRE